MSRKKSILLLSAVLFALSGCTSGGPDKEGMENTMQEETVKSEEEMQIAEEEPQDGQEETETQPNGFLVVVDPGHSSVMPEGMEPVGPGSQEFKAADTIGTTGVITQVPEYELTLAISIKLREELEQRGYTVILTRETSDEPLSCIKRAAIANDAGADAMIRIHANGSDNPENCGAMTICITPQNPYIGELYPASRRLSDYLITEFCNATRCYSEGVWETDSMSGNNYSQVPVTILEMGYMTNEQEDMLMQQEEYQKNMVTGIANGVDAYFENEKEQDQ